MRTFVHFMYVPFTGLGIRGGYRGDKWLKNRIRVFKQFVLPSLTNQTSQQFILWISWRPEDKCNPIVKDFYKTLDSIRGMRVVFTYGGLCFWDDKYPDDRLLDRLKATLPKLKSYVQTVDEVFMTIQPSDDLYIDTAVSQIRAKFSSPKFKRQGTNAVGWRKGYIMNYADKMIATYNPKTIPPFFTIRFPTPVFVDPQQHYDYTGPYKSHEFVVEHMKWADIKGRGFIVGTHGENISTVWDHPYQGALLSPERTERTLLRFGIWLSDPVVVRKGVRLLARRVLNMLPFNESIRSIYHKLPLWLQRL